MEIVCRDVEHIACLDGMGRPFAFRLACPLDDEHLVLVVMLMVGCMASRLHDEVTKCEVGSIVCSTNHHLHGHVLDAFHVNRGRGVWVRMPDQHREVLRMDKV